MLVKDLKQSLVAFDSRVFAQFAALLPLFESPAAMLRARELYLRRPSEPVAGLDVREREASRRCRTERMLAGRGSKLRTTTYRLRVGAAGDAGATRDFGAGVVGADVAVTASLWSAVKSMTRQVAPPELARDKRQLSHATKRRARFDSSLWNVAVLRCRALWPEWHYGVITGVCTLYTLLKSILNVPCGWPRNVISGPKRNNLPRPSDASTAVVPPCR